MWYLFAIVSPPKLATLVLGASFLSLSAQAQETTLQGEPFGYVKINITAGTGTGKKTTLLSLPLLEEAGISGLSSGRITGLSANTITLANAGWTPGELSAAASPYLIEITSGEAQGRMFLISTATPNTADTLTIDNVESVRVPDLRTLEILTGAQSGDTFKIRPVDTISSFFGTPATTLVQGGTDAKTADSITMLVNGISETYYYKTNVNPPRWTRAALGNPDASNTRIPPYAGLQYARLGSTPLEFIVTGKVPTGPRQVAVKRSGTTLFSPYWPVTQTLADLALHTIPGWAVGATQSAADTVVLSSGGTITTYFYDGDNWRRVALGNPLANATAVPVGTSVLINKKGIQADYADYQQAAPYNVQ
jgi:hypothetical protein